MKYKNPYYRKVKGSFPMLVSCGYCKTDLALYSKKGKGGLINMYIDRIVESNFDIQSEDRGLNCPECGEQLASRMNLKSEDKMVYKMIRSTFNTSRLNG